MCRKTRIITVRFIVLLLILFFGISTNRGIREFPFIYVEEPINKYGDEVEKFSPTKIQ